MYVKKICLIEFVNGKLIVREVKNQHETKFLNFQDFQLRVQVCVFCFSSVCSICG